MFGHELNRQLTRHDILPILVGVAATVALLHYAGVSQDAKIWLIVSLWISQAIGVILHEMGHALAALATGGEVQAVRLGLARSGREPRAVQVLGLPFLIYGFPVCGSVQSILLTTHQYRAKRCLMIAGGPLANVLLLLAGLALQPAYPEPTGHAVLLGWVLAQSTLLAVSLTPMTVRSYNHLQGNDAMLFWQTLHYSDEVIQHHVDSGVLYRNLEQDISGAKQMSIPDLVAKHKAEPQNSTVLLFLIEKLRDGYDPRHLDYLLELIDLPLSKDVIVEFIDAGLTRELNQGPPERPELIDQLSVRLLSLEDTVSTRGTRGSVLVDLGRIEEGWTMLQDVLWKTKSEFDKVYVHIFLALAEKHRGNIAVACEHAREAARIDPACPALQRL